MDVGVCGGGDAGVGGGGFFCSCCCCCGCWHGDEHEHVAKKNMKEMVLCYSLSC